MLALPLSGLHCKSTFFALGSVYLAQDSTIWVWISFLDSLLFPGPRHIEILNLLGSCRRQGMLAQTPAPGNKWKLIISSFLTLPYWSDCVICTRNVMPILLFLQVMGRWDRCSNGSLKLGCMWGYRGWVSSYQGFFPCAPVIFSLTFLVPWLRWLELDGCCLVTLFLLFHSFVQPPLTYSH